MLIKGQDLLITLPKFTSEDARIRETRNKMVNYLSAMELEYMEKKSMVKTDVDNWAEGFEPSHYEIPMKLLPSHPDVANAEIRNMSRE